MKRSTKPDPRPTPLARKTPFGNLDRIVEAAGIVLRSDEVEPAPAPTKVVAEPAPEPTPRSDEEVFAEAMDGVTRAAWRPLWERESGARRAHAHDATSEDMRLMEAALRGEPAKSALDDHPEYIEGWVGADGKRLLPKLRSGVYSIQAQIDLHGLGLEEARETVDRFVATASRFRSCCVKIIHGRGINSPNDRAVLKENLERWLRTRRMARHVVAYASAHARDGGVGAIYVLLRQHRE